MRDVERSSFTIDLGAIRRNAELLVRSAGAAELWAVVKAEGYGHGAVEASRAALDGGATALCVATLPEALSIRAALHDARVIVMGPVSERDIANSAATLRIPEARFDAVRCGIALYGISPFDDDGDASELEPALRWESYLALVKLLQPGESTGYGRRFVAERPTWVGIVPVGYADGFRRDMTGTEIVVEGERRRVVGTISMDALAVELDRSLPAGSPVTLVGDGVRIEEHARVADTIGYEIATGLNTRSKRARRICQDG